VLGSSFLKSIVFGTPSLTKRGKAGLVKKAVAAVGNPPQALREGKGVWEGREEISVCGSGKG